MLGWCDNDSGDTMPAGATAAAYDAYDDEDDLPPKILPCCGKLNKQNHGSQSLSC